MLDRRCGAILSLLLFRTDEIKNRSYQQRIQYISSYFISVPSEELEGGTKIYGGIYWLDVDNKIKYAGFSSSEVAAVIFPVPLT